MELAKDIYRLTEKFPREEQYVMTSQLRRAAISIPSNIAEGSRRSTRKDFGHFIRIAYGSGSELETQLMLAKTLEFGEKNEYPRLEATLSSVMRMLNKLDKSLRYSDAYHKP